MQHVSFSKHHIRIIHLSLHIKYIFWVKRIPTIGLSDLSIQQSGIYKMDQDELLLNVRKSSIIDIFYYFKKITNTN